MKSGDCIFCIIHEQGLLPEAIWKHSNNTSLRERRNDLAGIMPGDVLFLPDRQPKIVQAATNQVHKYRLKGENHRHWIEIELIGEDGKPCPHEKYQVKLPDGSLSEGNLDRNGWAQIESYPTGDCEVTFPKLDENAWDFVKETGAKKSG